MAETIKVASKKDIPEGESRIVRAKEKEIALFNVGGVIYATDNVCAHRGGPLGEGQLDGTLVTCPWHGWQFDVTTGESPLNSMMRVRSLPVRVEGNEVKVEL